MILRQLEQENTRPKKLLAERDLDIEIMKEVNANKLSDRRCWQASDPDASLRRRIRVSAS